MLATLEVPLNSNGNGEQRRRAAAGRRQGWRQPLACWGGAALLGLLASTGAVVRAQGSSDTGAAAPPQRPEGLVVLYEHQGHQGRELIGVFMAEADGRDPQLRKVRVWRETDSSFRYDIDKINCSPSSPLRITGLDGQLIVRQLNPGGLITPANRLDHQIWWAACHPSLAGKDPATLGAEARRLGYSGQVVEEQQILRLPGGPSR